ncbi:MAG: hypothetical protein HND57_03025 [Planctomycetes bacterium]|nr:hypothetical protein [Planctomycetota bacterium]
MMSRITTCRCTFGNTVIHALMLGALIGACPPSYGHAQTLSPPTAEPPESISLNQPLFVHNQGQWPDESVHFGLSAQGIGIALYDSAIAFNMRAADSEASQLTLTFPGAHTVEPTGINLLPTRINYAVGGNGRQPRSGVPTYSGVVYSNLYNGIDLTICAGSDGLLKYEFQCEPGADPSQITFQYDGLQGSLCLDESDGSLLLDTAAGTLTDAPPVAWQTIDGLRTDIPLHYELLSNGSSYAFSLDADVDPAHPLTIDPVLEWMLYLGGFFEESASDVVADGTNAAFVVGTTSSQDFAGGINSFHGGDTDSYVAKILPSGSVEWMTYLGGNDREGASGIVLDPSGNIFVSGGTSSSDFEGRLNDLHNGADVSDAYLAKLQGNGTVEWMIYLGGSAGDGAAALAMDSSGALHLVGATYSDDFEGRINNRHSVDDTHDSFVAVVQPNGILKRMTYLGGSEHDLCTDIALDELGNAFISGWTFSKNFEGMINSPHGYQDGYIAKLDPTGTIEWVTYIGGWLIDYARAISLDDTGAIYTAGHTNSNDFDGRLNDLHGYDEGFAAKLTPSGLIDWMVYLGGDSNDTVYDMVLTDTGHMLVTGASHSEQIEGRTNTNHGQDDAFVIDVGSNGAVEWVYFMGGEAGDIGHAITLVEPKMAYVLGETRSMFFEGRLNSLDDGVLQDAFLTKVSLTPAITLTAITSCPEPGPIHIEWSNATPDGPVALIYARNEGSVIVPDGNPCACTQLDLGAQQIQLVYHGTSDAAGSGTLNANAPASACGGSLQLLDLTTCHVSNAVPVE